MHFTAHSSQPVQPSQQNFLVEPVLHRLKGPSPQQAQLGNLAVFCRVSAQAGASPGSFIIWVYDGWGDINWWLWSISVGTNRSPYWQPQQKVWERFLVPCGTFSSLEEAAVLQLGLSNQHRAPWDFAAFWSSSLLRRARRTLQSCCEAQRLLPSDLLPRTSRQVMQNPQLLSSLRFACLFSDLFVILWYSHLWMCLFFPHLVLATGLVFHIKVSPGC